MKILLLGGGGHGRVVLDALRAAGWEVTGIVDDDPGRAGTTVDGVPILGVSDRLREFRERAPHAAVAIGDNRVRLDKQRWVESLGFDCPAVIHPRAVVSGSAWLGAGTLVVAGAVVNPGARIGMGTIVNTGATVDHDCELADGVHVAPGAHLAGGVHVGSLAHIGIGASVVENVRIGAEAVVGAGAAVVEDVPAGAVVVGVPARPVRVAG